jgi:hypothetical protein
MIRKKKRKIHLIKQRKSKGQELEDLQIQMIDFKLYEMNSLSYVYI